MAKLSAEQIRRNLIASGVLLTREPMPVREKRVKNLILSRTNAVLARRSTFKQA